MEREPGYQKVKVERTSPAWRLTAVGLFFAALFFGGWFARILQIEEQFSMFFVLVTFFAAGFWMKKRPDKLRRRFGAFGKIANAVQESADDIRASIYRKSIYYGIGFGAIYALLAIVTKELVYAVVISIYAWQILAALGCLVAAVVIAPEFFSAAARHLSIPDEDYPEEPREVERPPDKEGIGGGRDVDVPRHTEEARPEEDEETWETNSGIGFYDEEGNQLSPEEFKRLFSSSGDRDEE